MNEAPDYPKEVNEIYQARRDALVRRPQPHRLGARPARGDDVRLGAHPRAVPRDGLARVLQVARAARPRSPPRPGVGFGPGGDGYVRFALIENEQRISQAVRNLRRASPSSADRRSADPRTPGVPYVDGLLGDEGHPHARLLRPRRVKVEGKENLPRHGPAVLAANHQSFCDSLFIPLVVRRRVTFLAKAEYFDDRRDRLVLPGGRPDPHPPGRRAGVRAGARDRPGGGARPRPLPRRLPRGHPVRGPVRPPRPHRRRPPVARVRRPRHPGRRGRDRRRPARRAPTGCGRSGPSPSGSASPSGWTPRPTPTTRLGRPRPRGLPGVHGPADARDLPAVRPAVPGRVRAEARTGHLTPARSGPLTKVRETTRSGTLARSGRRTGVLDRFVIWTKRSVHVTRLTWGPWTGTSCVSPA